MLFIEEETRVSNRFASSEKPSWADYMISSLSVSLCISYEQDMVPNSTDDEEYMFENKDVCLENTLMDNWDSATGSEEDEVTSHKANCQSINSANSQNASLLSKLPSDWDRYRLVKIGKKIGFEKYLWS